MREGRRERMGRVERVRDEGMIMVYRDEDVAWFFLSFLL